MSEILGMSRFLIDMAYTGIAGDRAGSVYIKLANCHLKVSILLVLVLSSLTLTYHHFTCLLCCSF